MWVWVMGIWACIVHLALCGSGTLFWGSSKPHMHTHILVYCTLTCVYSLHVCTCTCTLCIQCYCQCVPSINAFFQSIWILVSNVPDVIPGVHLSTEVYRKEIYSRSVSLTSLLHLTVHARCTCPLELGPKLPSSDSFSSSCQVYCDTYG